jgi:hypothetical protein
MLELGPAAGSIIWAGWAAGLGGDYFEIGFQLIGFSVDQFGVSWGRGALALCGGGVRA